MTAPRGGTVDRIKTMLDNMTELSDEELAELQSSIVSEFETVESEEPTPQTVEAMTSLADMLDTVRGEFSRREAQAAELAMQAEDAANRVYGTQEEVPAEAEVAPDAESPAEDATEPTEEEMPMEEDKKKEEAPAAFATEEVVEETAAVELAVEEEAPVAELAVEEAVEDVVAEAELSDAETEGSELSTENPEESELSTEETIDAPVEVQEEIVEAPVTAAANGTPEVPAAHRPEIQAVEIPVAITAGADIPGITAGSELSNMTDVAEAFAKRLHGLRRVNGGDGEQHIVASFSTLYPEALQLNGTAEENGAKIKEFSSASALVAAGGYQSPYTTRYEIFGLGTNVRPVRDALPSFQADRGGVRYIVPPVLADYGSAVGIWSAATDIAVGAGSSTAVKDSLTVTAASETTAVADAVTLQMQFGNLATRAYPELIARHNELGLIMHAREAEQNLLSKIAAGSTAVTSTNVLGVAADFLVQIGRAATHYRLRHRMDAGAALRLVAPVWVRDAMVADLALQMPGDNKWTTSYGEVESALAARGVNVTWTIDADLPAAESGSAALVEFKDTFTWYLFAEGTFLFLDGGTLDVGIIRDSTLVGTNDYKMFVETFEGIAKVGVESLAVTSTISVNGARAALRDTLAGTASATIEF